MNKKKKYPEYFSSKQQNGAATIIITVVLLFVCSLIILFAAQFAVMQQKITSNSYRSLQAYEAAEAGLEYAMIYLNKNSSTIIANPVSGYINYGASDSNLTNVTLANNAKFSVTYTNPTANNYSLLTITSTGTSDDGVSTRTVKQQVFAGVSYVDAAVTTKGNFTLNGNVSITGSSGIHSGGTENLSGTNSISSILQNDLTLKNISSDTLFSNIFGVTKAQMQTQSTYFENGSGLVYNSLTGKNWINSSVIILGTQAIGTAINPVLLVVNGSFVSSGTLTIYGVVYVTGITITSGTNFNGGIISEGAITMSSTTGAYNSAILKTFTTRNYAKVPGTWVDF